MALPAAPAPTRPELCRRSTAKRLLQLGRDTKIVEQAAQANEAAVAGIARERDLLLVRSSELELDRDRWHDEAIARAEAQAILVNERDAAREEYAVAHALHVKSVESLAAAQRTIDRLKSEGVDNVRLRKRLQERDTELATERRKHQELTRLLRRYEDDKRVEVAARSAFAAAEPAGIDPLAEAQSVMESAMEAVAAESGK
mgnify:CR=1 FL=1